MVKVLAHILPALQDSVSWQLRQTPGDNTQWFTSGMCVYGGDESFALSVGALLPVEVHRGFPLVWLVNLSIV
jgi:hypothetical protein